MKFIEQHEANFVQKYFPPGPKALEDFLLSSIKGRYVMCVLKLDVYCHKRLGYKEEEHGSLEDFCLNVVFNGDQDKMTLLKKLLDLTL